MSRKDQLQNSKLQRELLIKELESFYINAFERIASLDLGEKNIAKLTQTLLQSRDAAISILQKEIEMPLITRAPKNK